VSRTYATLFNQMEMQRRVNVNVKFKAFRFWNTCFESCPCRRIFWSWPKRVFSFGVIISAFPDRLFGGLIFVFRFWWKNTANFRRIWIILIVCPKHVKNPPSGYGCGRVTTLLQVTDFFVARQSVLLRKEPTVKVDGEPHLRT